MKLRFRNEDNGKDPPKTDNITLLLFIIVPSEREQRKEDGERFVMSLLQVFIMNLFLRMYQMTKKKERETKTIIITLAFV